MRGLRAGYHSERIQRRVARNFFGLIITGRDAGDTSGLGVSKALTRESGPSTETKCRAVTDRPFLLCNNLLKMLAVQKLSDDLLNVAMLSVHRVIQAAHLHIGYPSA